MIISIRLWLRLTKKWYRLILLLLFLLEVPISIIFLNRLFSTYIDSKIPILSGYRLFLYIGCLILLSNTFIAVSVKESKLFLTVAQLIGLSKRQLVFYELYTLLPFFELGLCLNYMFNDRNTLLQIIISTFIYICTYFVSVLTGTIVGISESSHIHQNKSIIPRSTNNFVMDMIFITIKQKYRCYEVLILNIIITVLTIYLAIAIPGFNEIFLLFILLTLLLSNDKCFECDAKSFKYLSAINISYEKYLIIQYTSTLLLNAGAIIVLLFITTSGLRLFLSVTLLLYFVLFWVVTFVYIELAMQLSSIKRFWVEIINILIGLLPFLGIVFIIVRIQKSRENWK